MDAVPDSVLICSKQTESQAIRSIYGNSRINSFFGSDVLKSTRVSRNGNEAFRLKKVPSPYAKNAQNK